MLRNLYSKACRLIAHRYDKLALKLHRAAVIYIDAYTNTEFDFRINGEMRVLDRLLPLCGDKPVVFDIGCNTGEWSQCCLERRSDIALHGFEIAAPIQEEIRRRLGRVPNFTLCCFGLSDRDDTVNCAYYAENSVLTSLVKDLPRRAGGKTLTPQFVEGRVERGDDYCRRSGIGHIDFVKVDVEGHEWEVLDGFGDMLAEKRIDALQFEFGFEAFITGRTLRQYVQRFNALGYTVGRVLTVGVYFSHESRQFERLAFGDYVAVRSDRPELIAALEPDNARMIYDP